MYHISSVYHVMTHIVHVMTHIVRMTDAHTLLFVNQSVNLGPITFYPPLTKHGAFDLTP